jgi:hypothetical protein
MKNARKILALVLSLVMLLALGVTSYADYDYAANAKLPVFFQGAVLKNGYRANGQKNTGGSPLLTNNGFPRHH